jgi:hypothetical protein
LCATGRRGDRAGDQGRVGVDGVGKVDRERLVAGVGDRHRVAHAIARIDPGVAVGVDDLEVDLGRGDGRPEWW